MRLNRAIGISARVVIYGGLGCFLVLFLFPQVAPRLSGGLRGKHLREQHRFEKMFNSGDTNVPLLAMDWFSEHGVYFCRVKRSGDVFSARDVGHAIQGGSGISSRFSLGSTNRPRFELLINRLPGSSNKRPPEARQMLISGIRSNEWFANIYDRANIPSEVEQLYALTGAYLEWFIPRVGSISKGVSHAMSQHDPNSFVIAHDAPIAVSTCANLGLQIWTLKGGSAVKTGALNELSSPWKEHANHLWGIQTITPDGQIIIFAVQDVLFALKWQTQEILWHQNHMAWGNTYHASHRTLAMGKDGKTFFAVVGNSIERWSVIDGTKISTLATNASGIKVMETSLDGEFLIAGFGDNSFVVWKSAQDEPLFRFSEPSGADCVAVASNGRRMVLARFGKRQLIVYDWQGGRRSEFPLRTPYASSSAYSLCWSPDERHVAAYIDTYPATVIIYETDTWKPIANWPCGAIGSHAELGFDRAGVLFQMMDGRIASLDVSKLKSLSD